MIPLPFFIADVVDVDDGGHGKILIRAHPYHEDLPESDLPWAQCLQPIQSAADQGIGISPTGVRAGSSVFGLFLDAVRLQIPFVLGTFAGENDLPEEATGTNNVPRTRAPGEPSSSYAAQYPYNHVYRTPAGHVIEVDDTDGAERIHIFHREGTYIEMRPDGSCIYKTDGDRFDMTVGSQRQFVQDDLKVFVNGRARIQVEGDVDVATNSTATISAATKIILASPEIEINGATQFDSEGDAQEQEAYDDGDDAVTQTVDDYINSLIAEGATVVPGPAPVTNFAANTAAQVPVTCGNYSETSPQIVALTSGTVVSGARGALSAQPSWPKTWRGRTGTRQLTKAEVICNLGAVHENIVKKLFDRFGRDKFNINSGFRTGSGGSQHDAGMAVDIQIKAGTGFGLGNPTKTIEYLNWIRDNCTFDQLAIEYSARFPNQCWIHASYVRPENGTNRGMWGTWDAAKSNIVVAWGQFVDRTR